MIKKKLFGWMMFLVVLVFTSIGAMLKEDSLDTKVEESYLVEPCPRA